MNACDNDCTFETMKEVLLRNSCSREDRWTGSPMVTLSGHPTVRIGRGCWIQGHEVETTEGFAVENPADGSVVAIAPLADREVVHQAVDAAVHAFPLWKQTSLKDRLLAIRRLALAVKGCCRDIAGILSREGGKPIKAALAEVENAVEFLLYCAEEGKQLASSRWMQGGEGDTFLVVREPVGPCGIITPFNYPVSTLVTKIGPALAVGCSVVVKPDEHTPLSTLYIARLTEEVGFLPGVVNVVTGPGRPTGEALVIHPAIRLLSFTGSTEVGKELYARSAPFVRRLTLELGGNCPALIAPDARWRHLLPAMVHQAFKHSGQYCYRITRFLVHRSIHDAFLEEMVREVGKLTVGDPQDLSTDLGPLNNRRIYDRFSAQIERVLERGARIAFGSPPSQPPQGKGYYCTPLVIAHVTNPEEISREEFFGPVVFVIPYRTDEEAISLCIHLYRRYCPRGAMGK